VLAPDPDWALLILDKNFAYFALTPKPWTWYNARRAPFVTGQQCAEAMKLARMPLKTFTCFAEKYLPDPKGPIVYYSNGARTGSTLLLRVMQVSDERIMCLGEPEAFSSLAILKNRGYVNHDFCVDLSRAIFKFYCKHQMPGQTYLIKVSSNAVQIVPHIKQAMPEVKHMFGFRRNTTRVISSLEKMIRATNAGDAFVVFWNIHPELACWALSIGGIDYQMCKQFGVRDCLDFAIIFHVSSFYHYYKDKEIFDIPLVNYEDLITEKEKTLRNIFDLCQLPFDEFINVALDEFKFDSQGGTSLSQDSLKSVPVGIFNEEKLKKMNEMCDHLKIPRIPA